MQHSSALYVGDNSNAHNFVTKVCLRPYFQATRASFEAYYITFHFIG